MYRTRLDRISPLSKFPNYGVEIVVCGNPEILGVSDEGLPYTADEAVCIILDQVAKHIYSKDLDFCVHSLYSDWNGGYLGRSYFYGSRFASRKTHVEIYKMENDVDEDGEIVPGSWQHCAEPPQEILDEVAVIQGEIENCIIAELRRLDNLAEENLRKWAAETSIDAE